MIANPLTPVLFCPGASLAELVTSYLGKSPKHPYPQPWNTSQAEAYVVARGPKWTAKFDEYRAQKEEGRRVHERYAQYHGWRSADKKG